MHENIAKLYPNPETSGKVIDYSITKSTPLPDWLLKYHKWGVENTSVPDFLISTFQAQMLVFLTKIVAAKQGEYSSSQPYPRPYSAWLQEDIYVLTVSSDLVLELGVYIGFSGMVWSHAVGKDGKVVGLELSEEYAGIAEKAFAENGVKNVELKIGDAVET